MEMQELQKHIEQIAEENGVTIDWREQTNGRSWAKSKKIRVKYIKSVVTYAIALHELGHVLGKKSGRRIDKEVQAWEWAKENALVWNKSMKKTASNCLQSYVNWSFRSKRAVKPTMSHPIYKWIKK